MGMLSAYPLLVFFLFFFFEFSIQNMGVVLSTISRIPKSVLFCHLRDQNRSAIAVISSNWLAWGHGV